MSAELIERARAGDADAFAVLVGPYRRELQVHCYRILGSVQDAEDALQESLLSAWQSFESFQGRSSLRTWLYRVATNRSLDALRAAARKPPVTTTPTGLEPPEPTRLAEVTWLQPYPDVLLGDLPDTAPGPAAVIEQREATSLAFVTVLQLLPPRQRAVLILRDVLGYHASEVAAMLESTEESVTSALKRARAALADPGHYSRRPLPPTAGSAEERRVADQFVEAFAAHDVDAIVALLTEGAWVKMPPMPFEYQGRQAAARFFTAIAPPRGRELRCVRTRANGQPAFATYAPDPAAGVWRASGLIVLTLAGDRVSDVVRFETAVLASFGLPRILHAPPIRRSHERANE
ncbi:MAG: sigW [Actinomycetia bacterium]|nr:sigW [Actinomycetes bacterium]